MKEISRFTTCVPFVIGTPIWNGGRRVVGLNKQRIGANNEITFSYVRKSDGKKSFPDTYYFDGSKISKNNYVEMNTKGVNLVLVPFTDLEILVRV